MPKLTGAAIVVESLIKEGVTHIFGYPGGVVIPLMDKLYDTKDIRFILTRHEQGASHAADGYSRATGKVGVCIATSGPGATNLVTGIATAYMDSIPVVIITGQVKSFLIGNDAFQEADVIGITRSITKHSYLVKDVKELAKTIKEAFYIAKTGRPGPVVIDLPVDVQLQEIEFTYPETVDIRGYKPAYKGHPLEIKKIIDSLEKSKRPVIYAGGGIIISGASEELLKFSHKTGIPVTTTMMGLGGFPSDDKLSLGMLGMHGTAYANHAIQESDFILAIGARFDDRVTGRLDTFAPNAQIAHIDIDPSSISKNIPVHIPIIGDAKSVLKELNELAKKLDIKIWHNRIEQLKKELPLKYRDDEKLRPQYVLERLQEVTRGKKVIIATEVGQNQMWSTQFYKYKEPRTWVSSGGMGTMGYGFPAAIGAQLGKPDYIVFDIAGDGSIQMNIQELATAVIEKVPVKVIILNNSCLGMVRQWQELFFKKRYAFTILNKEEALFCPDFVKLAESYGAKARRISKKEDVDSAIKWAIETEGPVFLDFLIEKTENVFPMVPAGETISNMLYGLA
ncbi:acetolactate synthase large subunit, biosynthetic type [Candidatus Omnitrophus magneticus]|uniref:Acetolactate synthase n=1 Tax=Candidatus Omnitrophus magneticus TaxID=1609969 RepID=A0A0F0CPZ9_9BACT|nr:acetolactate synthase large subunit, biosynthetic type [Candidatus Omnitrophus magneticus]